MRLAEKGKVGDSNRLQDHTRQDYIDMQTMRDSRFPMIRFDDVQLVLFYITEHPTPYIALSTSPLTKYQSARLSANSYTSSAAKIP